MTQWQRTWRWMNLNINVYNKRQTRRVMGERIFVFYICGGTKKMYWNKITTAFFAYILGKCFSRSVLFLTSYYMRYSYCCNVNVIALPLICFSSVLLCILSCSSVLTLRLREGSSGTWMSSGAITSINHKILSRTCIHFKVFNGSRPFIDTVGEEFLFGSCRLREVSKQLYDGIVSG